MIPTLFRNSFSSPNPRHWLANWDKEMDRIFDSFTNWMPRELESLESQYPSTDLKETESHYLVSVELPGIPKEDIDVELRDNRLTVSAHRHTSGKKANGGSREERRFYASFLLPEGVETEKCEASHRDGILYLAVEKPEAVKPKRISIGDGSSGTFKRLLGSAKEKVVKNATKGAA